MLCQWHINIFITYELKCRIMAFIHKKMIQNIPCCFRKALSEGKINGLDLFIDFVHLFRGVLVRYYPQSLLNTLRYNMGKY